MTRIIDYEDLALAIELDGEGGYRVRTLSSPYGLTAEPFTLPFGRQEMEEIVQEVGAGLAVPARDLRPTEPRRAAGLTFRETGARLFRSLFLGTLHETYLRSYGRFESRPGQGLRLRIVLPVDIPDAGLLQALPWELLYCEQTADFLARNVLTPVVRQLALSGVAPSLPGTEVSRIRVLIAVANPRGLPLLDHEDEHARILQAWRQQPRAEVKLLQPATLRNLTEALRSDHHQVVHFICHGAFDAEAGEGSLLLETPAGELHFVSGDVLAETLRASRELRLVFLNSCKSAQAGRRPGQDPLLGTAAALVRRGLPAVIAMTAPISDSAARLFSEAVYRSLAGGSSLEAAVTDGRLALFQENSRAWEWITPALFAALADSSVFRPLCSAAENLSARQEEAAHLLQSGSYARAQKLIESCLEQGEDLADFHYYRALAHLGGRQPRHLKLEEFRRIEASARRVLPLADRAAHHLCFLAFLQRDFYLTNHLLPPEPGYDELLQQAVEARVDRSRLDELVRLVPEARHETESLTQRLGSIPQ